MLPNFIDPNHIAPIDTQNISIYFLLKNTFMIDTLHHSAGDNNDTVPQLVQHNKAAISKQIGSPPYPISPDSVASVIVHPVP